VEFLTVVLQTLNGTSASVVSVTVKFTSSAYNANGTRAKLASQALRGVLKQLSAAFQRKELTLCLQGATLLKQACDIVATVASSMVCAIITSQTLGSRLVVHEWPPAWSAKVLDTLHSHPTTQCLSTLELDANTSIFAALLEQWPPHLAIQDLDLYVSKVEGLPKELPQLLRGVLGRGSRLSISKERAAAAVPLVAIINAITLDKLTLHSTSDSLADAAPLNVQYIHLLWPSKDNGMWRQPKLLFQTKAQGKAPAVEVTTASTQAWQSALGWFNGPAVSEVDPNVRRLVINFALKGQELTHLTMRKEILGHHESVAQHTAAIRTAFPSLIELQVCWYGDGLDTCTMGKEFCNTIPFQLGHYSCLERGRKELAKLTLALDIASLGIHDELLTYVLQRVLWSARAEEYLGLGPDEVDDKDNNEVQEDGNETDHL
jgi:hypothetical protein